MHFSRLIAGIVAALALASAVAAQEPPPPPDAGRGLPPVVQGTVAPGSLEFLRIPPRGTLILAHPSILRIPAPDEIIPATRSFLRPTPGTRVPAAAGNPAAGIPAAVIPPAGIGPSLPILVPPAAVDTPPPLPTDTLAAPEFAELSLQLRSRLEVRMEQNRNERCSGSLAYLSLASCNPRYQPIVDFQFNVLSGGVVADRVHVDVDYSSEREFDASNNISVYYQGLPTETIHRIEVGNVSFTPPASRFITSGIPSGNYGLQATGRIGPMFFRGIAAQQKGNVVQATTFTIGDRTRQPALVELDDYRFEPRRFFFTIDPELLPGYPNIDLLDTRRMGELAAALPDTLRPTRLYLYRMRIGGQPPNPNGPRFIPRGARNENRGPVYEYLREGIDYYADPSNLWIALVRTLGTTERLVVAWNVLLHDGTTVYPPTGGTPDLESRPEPQFANLLWDPEVQPGDAVFNREIRSVYRIGGDEIVRETLGLTIGAGIRGEQEKPASGLFESYLQLFGLSQPTSPSTFDVENRLWPRTTDPVFDRGAGGENRRLIRDQYLVFPSVEPFSSRGLVPPGNPVNDALYTTAAEDIYSSRRPQTVYHIRARYESEGSGESGTIALGAVQLRRNSERVEIDGLPLTRDVDYTVDYDLGRITFTRPDTLFQRERRVNVRFEENPLFAEQPTGIFALSTHFPMERGDLTFTAIRQQQRSTFNRPQLGFEPASSLVAGVSGNFRWDATALTAGLSRLPFVNTSAPSRIAVRGELAMSRPDPNTTNQAYLESFDADGGTSVPLFDPLWYYSSQPVASASLPEGRIPLERAATMTWQNNAVDREGNLLTIRTEDIDPNVLLTGSRFSTPETLLWMTLYPLAVGRTRDPRAEAPDWTIANAPTGERWRSIRVPLGNAGSDLTRVEHLEFWALVDTTAVRRGMNPTLVIDFGEVSENSVAFAPDTLLLDRNAPGGGAAAGWRGRQIEGAGVLNSERDPFTRAFDASVNDTGLPGDVAGRVSVLDASTGQFLRDSLNVPVCRADRRVQRLGDPRANCTVRNDRLDEEDIDGDGVLNFDRDGERLVRFVVNMADASIYSRVGFCLPANDPRNPGNATRCWVHVRLPFGSPTETIGAPQLRRVKAARITMLSGSGVPDNEFVQLPVARMRLVGAPWLKRADNVITGIAGEHGAGGYVIASLIGTQDSSAAVPYVSPPGVRDLPESRETEFGATQVQINERSLRLQAGGLELFDRAEAYFRFPEGQKSFMGYQQLRLWARGRGSGWGDDAELQFYIKLGRDADNFYLYRTDVRSGTGQAAWEPEIRVDFNRFFALRARVQNAWLHGTEPVSGCTALDSALIAASGIPGSMPPSRHVACDGGYMVYTLDPGISAPSIAAVQEMAVGMIRVKDGALTATPIAPGDTLELWVNEIRLSGVVNEPGMAGHIGLDIVGADIGDLRMNLSRSDRNFRQLGEQPTFVTSDALDVISTVRLDRMLPATLGLSIPLTVSHLQAGNDPYFLSRSDILGEGLEGIRTPHTSSTSYALRVQRTARGNGNLSPILDNLALTSTWTSASARSEYQTSRANHGTLGVEYLIAAEPRSVGLPGWLDGFLGVLPDWLGDAGPVRAMREADYRWNPSRIRLSSGLVRGADRRVAYTLPVATESDTGRRVEGLNHVWRTAAALELRPVPALTARMDVITLRDLRDYGDTTEAARAARQERGELLGVDAGLERERLLQSSVSFAPLVTPWLRPRINAGSQFSMSRDPNARSLALTGDTIGDPRLPRRMNNAQTFGTTVTTDVRGAVIAAGVTGERSLALARIFAPVELGFQRSLVSSFDRTPFGAPLGFQFALGSPGDFRSLRGRAATSAGLTDTWSLSNALLLPFGTSLTNRYQLVEMRSWTRRFTGRQTEVEGEQRVFPDLRFAWSFRSATDPASTPLVASASAGAGYRVSERSMLVHPDIAGVSGDSTYERTRSYPTNVSFTWGLFGGFSTSAGYTLALREDHRPGTLLEARTRELSGDISKTIRARPSLRLESDLRTRLSVQRSETESWVVGITSGNTSRLTDNGRYSVHFSADTDLNESMTFSLTAARIINWDDTFNRRFTQTAFSAVLHLSFFGGDFR